MLKIAGLVADRRLAVAAISLFAAGVALSHRLEPGVQVQHQTIGSDIPALRFSPSNPGPHPTALLAHGVTASKETLFRFGEALAAAGFECVAIDFPGHGESPRRFSLDENVPTLEQASRALGTLDVFLGHSMGAAAGGQSVREANLTPRLFMAVGAAPTLAGRAPLLLLAGRFEEVVPVAQLESRTDARLVLSPWSDHALEPFDPLLVDAAVEAACAAGGKTPPAAPTRWCWRLAGMILVGLGAFGLIFCLPEFTPRWAWSRGPLVSFIAIVAVASTSATWFGAAPHLHRVHLYLAATALALLVVLGASKLGIPRWSFAAVAAALALACALFGHYFLALFAVLGTLVLLSGTVLGALATRRGSRRDGDIALAIFIGYAIGQWVPRFL